ncbi:hypothetical protein CHI02_21005 [Niallia circulans]|uniref:hypothetical protein n=1 Tax=Niallia circulans TaxID=1397 RepID=UPI000BA6F1AC|nr:hypothetical protein [Niallia circulans]PAE10179.1 hypothetical protein CHI02_21005 [Niallia circulans]
MIAGLIIACELGFWFFVLLGLATRYLLKKKTMGLILLLLTPIVDLLLLIFTVIDLQNGGVANFFHGLAAVYIGVSLAFGHKMIRWADQRFAYRFANGPAPMKPPKHGKEHASYERRGWFTHLLAWIIGAVLLYGLIWLVNDTSKTEQLMQMIKLWGGIVFIDFLYSFSFALWPRKAKHT